MHTHTLVTTDRLGSVFLFEDPLPSNVVQHVYTLGPSYYGAFQAPVLQDRVCEWNVYRIAGNFCIIKYS